MSDKRYLKSLILIPTIKALVFGPETKRLIKSAIMSREKTLKQGETLSVRLRGRTFDFRVLEAIPNNTYLIESTQFDIPGSGVVVARCEGFWWMP